MYRAPGIEPQKYSHTIARYNFVGLVLRVVRPFVASGNFCQPNPFFLFTTLLGTKGQLDRFRFCLEDMATARKYRCVV